MKLICLARAEVDWAPYLIHLEGAVDCSDYFVRKNAEQAMGKLIQIKEFDFSLILPMLDKLLRDESTQVRLAVLDVLEDMLSRTNLILNARRMLTVLLRDSSPNVLEKAVLLRDKMYGLARGSPNL